MRWDKIASNGKYATGKKGKRRKDYTPWTREIVLTEPNQKKRNSLQALYSNNKKIFNLTSQSRTNFYRSPDWHSIRQWARDNLGDRCHFCLRSYRIEVDHIVPVTMSPQRCLDWSNLQLLCHSCNQRKSNMGTRRLCNKKFFEGVNVPEEIRELRDKGASR